MRYKEPIMQFKDVTLKNIHTLPLAGIAFHRFDMESSQFRLLESIDAEVISLLNRDGPDAVYRGYEDDTVIRIEYENINGGIYKDIYLAERD